MYCCQTPAFHQGETSQLNSLHLEGHLSSRFLVSACARRRFVRAFNVQSGDESMCMFHDFLWTRRHVKLVGGFNFESTFGTLMRVQVVVCRKVSTCGFSLLYRSGSNDPLRIDISGPVQIIYSSFQQCGFAREVTSSNICAR